MNHRPSDDWSGADMDEEVGGRESLRVLVLTRASTAVRQAHESAADAAEAYAAAQEALLTSVENRARRTAERDARNELEEAVRRFATRLRAEGAPPELGVRRVKSAVEPAVYSSRDQDGSDVEWRRAVVGDVVKWFVEAYYAA